MKTIVNNSEVVKKVGFGGVAYIYIYIIYIKVRCGNAQRMYTVFGTRKGSDSNLPGEKPFASAAIAESEGDVAYVGLCVWVLEILIKKATDT